MTSQLSYGVQYLLKGLQVTDQETPTRWLWKFREHCYKSAEQAGVDNATVAKVMEQVGATPEVFPLGRGVTLDSIHEVNRLPVGSIVYTGSPESGSRFGVFRRTGRDADGWESLLGYDYLNHNYTVVIETLPGADGPPDWWTEPFHEEMAQALANAKAKAWRVGWKVKIAHSWCPSYEEYMKRIGLTAEVLRSATFEGISVGDRIEPMQVATLPEGSILRWVSTRDPETRWAWYIRDDSQDNRARTRYVFGRWDGRKEGTAVKNYASVMEVVHIHTADDQYAFVPPPGWEAIHGYLPVGTMIHRTTDPHTFYHLARDRRIGLGEEIMEYGSWRLGDFSNPGTQLLIARFPS